MVIVSYGIIKNQKNLATTKCWAFLFLPPSERRICHSERSGCHLEYSGCHPERSDRHPERQECHPERQECHPEHLEWHPERSDPRQIIPTPVRTFRPGSE